MNDRKRSIITFIIGFVMMVGGLFWFISQSLGAVGVFRIYMGHVPVGKIAITIPFLIGIGWLFLGTNKKVAQYLTIAGIVLIIVSLMLSIRFAYQPIPVYSYLGMLVLIFGGLWLMVKAST